MMKMSGYDIPLRVAVAGNVDSGKCHGLNTEILMYNGSTKKIQDIEVNDLLMGDDGTARKVLMTTSGFGQLYKIIPINGDSFTINKNHVLCFKHQNNYIDMPFVEYTHLNIDEKRQYKLYRKYKWKETVDEIENITIEKDQEYYGFELNGNGRYLLADFTVTHNSSLIGVLKTNVFDDGNGLSRKSVFNFPHEFETGRTSSVSQRPIEINGKKILFFDMAGHERYLRTTLFGLSSSYPDVALILIESGKSLVENKSSGGKINRQINRMTREHIITCVYFRIPMIFVFTKLDMAYPDILEKNMRDLKTLLSSVNIKAYKIKNEQDIIFCHNVFSQNISPIFTLSSVKGNDINPPFKYLPDFLHLLNVKKGKEDDDFKENLFVIEKSFKTAGFPMIASGYMKTGKISVNDKLYLGPFNNEYVEIMIRTIHDDNRNNVSFLRQDEMGCFSIKVKNDIIKNKYQIKAGMIISNTKKDLTETFIGKVSIFTHHSTSIKTGSNTVIHCGCIKQTVVLESMCNLKNEKINILRGGETGYITFRFILGKQFVSENEIFVFREGLTRGSGIITNIKK